MIGLEYVDRLKWSAELGKRLEILRGAISMRALADKVNSKGHQCSYQYIHKLEEGKAESVSTEIIIAVCDALGVDFKELYPSFYIEVSIHVAKSLV